MIKPLFHAAAVCTAAVSVGRAESATLTYRGKNRQAPAEQVAGGDSRRHLRHDEVYDRGDGLERGCGGQEIQLVEVEKQHIT